MLNITIPNNEVRANAISLLSVVSDLFTFCAQNEIFGNISKGSSNEHENKSESYLVAGQHFDVPGSYRYFVLK